MVSWACVMLMKTSGFDGWTIEWEFLMVGNNDDDANSYPRARGCAHLDAQVGTLNEHHRSLR